LPGLVQATVPIPVTLVQSPDAVALLGPCRSEVPANALSVGCKIMNSPDATTKYTKATKALVSLLSLVDRQGLIKIKLNMRSTNRGAKRMYFDTLCRYFCIACLFSFCPLSVTPTIAYVYILAFFRQNHLLAYFMVE